MKRDPFTRQLFDLVTRRRERDAVALTCAAARARSGLLIKFTLRGGGSSIIVLPSRLALHMRDQLRDGLCESRLGDLGSRPSLKDERVRLFVNRRQAITESDIASLREGKQPSVAARVEVRTFCDAVFLAFLIDAAKGIWKAFRLDPVIAPFLLEHTDEADRAGYLVDLNQIEPSTARPQ